MKGAILSIINSFPTKKIPSATRINLENLLKKHFKKLEPGIVLDVGAKKSPFRKYIPYTKYMTLDISKESKPDICCDIHNIKWRPGYFDTVIATELLEHSHTPQKAIDEIYKILKPGGVCIFSTRFICPYHPDPDDYFRFSSDGLRHLFRKFSKVDIEHQGNRLLVLWAMINYNEIGKIVLNIFNPLIARINTKKTNFPNGFIVYAEK